MAKKKSKTAKSSTAAKSRKPAAGKAAKRSPSKGNGNGHVHDEHCGHDEEIELDDSEQKAVDLVLDSDAMRDSLENEVGTAVTLAVRKVCKAHGAPLTAAQAQNVAIVLFGD
jgi:hypothetical protein